MEMHCLLTDAEFEQQFAQCTFTPQHFTHEAQLRLAWIHVSKYGEAAAARNLCQQIARFDCIFDDGTKLNYTVTVASTKVMTHFLAKAAAAGFEELIQEFPRLKTNFRDLLRTHYSFNIFANAQAKRQYVAPNLLAF